MRFDDLNLMKELNDKGILTEMPESLKSLYNEWRQGILLVQNILPGSILNSQYHNSYYD